MSICIKKYVKLLCTFSCLLIVDMHALNTGIIGRRLKKLPKISRETRRTYLDNGYFNSSVFENLVPTGEKSTALIVHPTANATIASRVVRGRPAPYAQELDTTKKLFDKPFNQSQQLATDQVFAGRQTQRKLAEQAWQKEHGTQGFFVGSLACEIKCCQRGIIPCESGQPLCAHQLHDALHF